jgi:hypothetical protein
MLYTTQNHWVCGLCPSSEILIARKHSVSELGLFPSSGKEKQTPTVLGPLGKANLNHWESLRLALSEGLKRVRAVGQ